MKLSSAHDVKAAAATIDISILFTNFIRPIYMSQYKSYEYREIYPDI